MGTPDFAVETLKVLHENGYPIVGVITSTDKWGGRNKKTRLESAVKKYAMEQDLPLLQPPNLKDPEFIGKLQALKPDLQIVVAFRMLPKIVWSLPRLGTVNLHASLLPKYRGAAPINWAIINGEKTTGVTTFFIREDIDTGDILFQEEVEITETDNAGSLHDKLMLSGAALMLKTVNAIAADQALPQPQSDAEATLAPKIFRETCVIDFNKNTREVYNFIRGLSPYPGAWTIFLGKEMKIFSASPEPAKHQYPAGTFLTDSKKYFRITTADGWVQVQSVQLQGKKKMEIGEFLNGLRLSSDDLKIEKIITE